MEVAVKTDTLAEKLFARDIAIRLRLRTFSDVGKSDRTRLEAVIWCDIEVCNSHVAHRDPDHTHWPSTLRTLLDTYTSTRRGVIEGTGDKKGNRLLVSFIRVCTLFVFTKCAFLH